MSACYVMLALVFMQYVCRFQNQHRPAEDVVDAFLVHGGEKLMTKCARCECDLALWADRDDEDLYWVVEV